MHKYHIIELGNATVVLGMRITRDRSRRLLTIDQSIYIERLLAQYRMSECKATTTPS